MKMAKIIPRRETAKPAANDRWAVSVRRSLECLKMRTSRLVWRVFAEKGIIALAISLACLTTGAGIRRGVLILQMVNHQTQEELSEK
jgi:hypothetical protein